MRLRRKVIRGRFGNRHSRASGLPPELVRLLAAERKRSAWRRYLPLWGGAVMVGLIIGGGPGLVRSMPRIVGEPLQASVQPPTHQKSNGTDQNWAQWLGLAGNFSTAATSSTVFGFCHTGAGTNCVVDGDTIWFQGTKIRIADIDAPETHDFRCAEEKVLGDRATQRLIQLVNSGPVSLELTGRDEDAYGRKLRIVSVEGKSVGATLVSEGLARFYEGGRKPWC